MQETIARLEREIAEKSEQLAAARLHVERLKANDPQAIAEALHSSECHWNHTDGCSWFYEKWDGPHNTTRMEWFAKAQTLIEWAHEHGIEVSLAVEIRTLSLR